MGNIKDKNLIRDIELDDEVMISKKNCIKKITYEDFIRRLSLEGFEKVEDWLELLKLYKNSEIDELINSETARRISADVLLQENINTEIEARTSSELSYYNWSECF